MKSRTPLPGLPPRFAKQRSSFCHALGNHAVDLAVRDMREKEELGKSAERVEEQASAEAAAVAAGESAKAKADAEAAAASAAAAAATAATSRARAASDN
eukprot:gene12207-biopygen12429